MKMGIIFYDIRAFRTQSVWAAALYLYGEELLLRRYDSQNNTVAVETKLSRRAFRRIYVILCIYAFMLKKIKDYTAFIKIIALEIDKLYL